MKMPFHSELQYRHTNTALEVILNLFAEQRILDRSGAVMDSYELLHQ